MHADRAREIATVFSRPESDFEYYPVAKDVGNVRNQGERLIIPL
ncbi:hypothetical protein NLO88_01860 [Pseudomonas syringae]|nr:hypothetical protein [Pseudomonas syringae]MCQ3029399.1 hypothetical protein [Pseudomonas syringae]